MKIRLGWIISAVALLSIAGILLPRLKHSLPSLGPGVLEPARAEQATPEATVSSMFQTTDQGEDLGNFEKVVSDRLDYMHMLQGKDAMTTDEQKFAGLFWDNQRSAAIYAYLRHRLTTSANVTANNTTGDSAVVSVTAKIFSEKDSEWWVDSPYTVELKKRGPNWYVDELKTSQWPEGVYHQFRKRLASTP
jgi:hypothetical protein